MAKNKNESGDEVDFSFLGGADGQESESTDSAFDFQVPDAETEVEPPSATTDKSFEVTDESAASAFQFQDRVPPTKESPPAIPKSTDGSSPDEVARSPEVKAAAEIPRAEPSLENPEGAAVEAALPQINMSAGTQPSATELPAAAATPKKAVRKLNRRSATTKAVPEPATEQRRASSESVPGTGDETAAVAPVEPATGLVSPRTFSIVAGYAAALTLLLLVLLLTGRISLTGDHKLESLPDIRPLKSNEFQQVPEGVSLPDRHELKLGQGRRFGDVVLTPTGVTREVVTALHRRRKDLPPEKKTDVPVLKLWFTLENVSADAAFPPWDVGLMCHRSPPFDSDADTAANSWLKVSRSDQPEPTRILNLLHSPDSEFELADQNAGRVLQPGESMTTYIVSSEDVQHVPEAVAAGYRWRLQLRKGVNRDSGNGVTTLVDITFQPSEIKVASGA